MQITHDRSGGCSGLTTWTDPQGALWCVVVVKSTYDLHDGRLLIDDRQRPLEVVDSYEGEPGHSSLRYENDYAPYKPAVDVVVRGQAWAPRGQPCSSCEIELHVGATRKRLRVHGPRVWRPGVLGIVPSSAQVFEHQPLRWESAHGGSGPRGAELRNPVGQGFDAGEGEGEIIGARAPSIEAADAPIERYGPRYAPAGVAAIARAWQPRVGAAGTFDAAWRRDRFPLLPADFRFEHFQIAPDDQRFVALEPKTVLAGVNLSRDGLLRAEVPPPPPPIQFHFADRLVEQVAVLDTIVLEPELELFCVSWRTRVALGRKPSRLREITIGAPRRAAVAVRSKPHFRSLGEFVTWAKRRRQAQGGSEDR
jgi:hypothetical protein